MSKAGRPRARDAQRSKALSLELASLHRDGHSTASLAKRFGLHQSTIWRRIQRAEQHEAEECQLRARIREQEYEIRRLKQELARYRCEEAAA